MSQICNITKCNRSSRGLCDCCKQNLCLQHLNEHNATLLAKLNPLVDATNTLGERLQRFDVKEATGDCYRQLEQWRTGCYKKIDQIFELKCQQLHETLNKKIRIQKEEIDRVQAKVNKFIHEKETTQQDLDLLTSAIHDLSVQIKSMEQTRFQINVRSFELDERYVIVDERNEQEIDLSTVSDAFQTFQSPRDSRMILACNDQNLVIHQKPNLCLIDQEMNIIKKTLWSYDKIIDMTWSSTLDKFIIINDHNAFLLDRNTLLIEFIQKIEQYTWLSCTCSERSLFLSTNNYSSSIMQYSLQPSIQLDRAWNSPYSCAWNELIHHITYQNKMLAIIIQNQHEKSLRLELRSIDTFDCIWFLELGIQWNTTIGFRFCTINDNEWLIVDHENDCLFHIDSNGKLKNRIDYRPKPYRAILFKPNRLVISTSEGIKFHKQMIISNI
ncbi:hypothetical protein I4U23_026019 [Adineta vaga]|nr:hypothetical protein I4U23_026019 [Adineta vaga]